MTAAERSFYMLLSLNIRQEMMRAGLNQTKLARGMRVDQVGLCLTLKGRRSMNTREFKRMIRFLGASISTLITPEVCHLAEQARLMKSSPRFTYRKAA